MTNIQDTLNERNKTHGNFSKCAEAAQVLKSTIPQFAPDLSYVLGEALDQIFSKIARVLTGDPAHADTWHDIAGYATLAEKSLTEGDNTDE